MCAAYVAKMIRTLVFAPAKKMFLSQLFLSSAVVCQEENLCIFPNIHLSINCIQIIFVKKCQIIYEQTQIIIVCINYSNIINYKR